MEYDYVNRFYLYFLDRGSALWHLYYSDQCTSLNVLDTVLDCGIYSILLNVQHLLPVIHMEYDYVN